MRVEKSVLSLVVCLQKKEAGRKGEGGDVRNTWADVFEIRWGVV